ncbi:MAG TPA: GAF domain-containing protein [Ktedonobacteraceae bacterium]|jgi:PAS domain S-box-containing protein|nr:GAF domain-containing protein [Ktedonobacteraceae bacterium]
MTTDITFTLYRQSLHGMAPVEGESQELVDVLQKIVQNAGALLEVEHCSVALLDIAGTALVTLAALQKDGRTPRRTRFQKSEGVAGWVAEHREPLVISDVSLDPRFKRLGRYPVGSMACVPLIDKETFIGTLTVSSPETGVFDARKLHMLTIFADQAVLAISNARQAELAQRQASQLEMLMNLSHGITTLRDAESLYRTILLNMQRLIPSQTARIYAYEERAQELYPVAELSATLSSDGSSNDEVLTIGRLPDQSISLANSESLVAWAAVHRHPMLRTPVKYPQDEGCVPEEGSNEAQMAAPLVSKDVLYGALVLRRTTPYASEELRLLRNLSNMAAAALENVELFHRVRSDQEQLRAIVEASSDGIALLGTNACFLEVNPSFGRIFGLEPQQIVGMEYLELFGCDNDFASEECRELYQIQSAIQEQQPLPYVEIEVPVKGVSRSIGLSITPVSVSNNPFCVLIARDMTAIRDMTRMKANFLSMITHELRSPINAINGYLDLALTGIAGELEEQQKEFIRRARSGSEHLYALVEDLLLVSRADSGQLRLNREIVNLIELVARAVEELELTATDNGLTISVEIPSDFPSIYADPVRLQQVLRNLLSNALRFTPAGGKVTIGARVIESTNNGEQEGEEPQKQVEVWVRDTGMGIPPEQQERIFERFYQIPLGGSGRSSGQGLGLAIVKMIVDLHEGKVGVESVPGEGSRFVFMLPGLLL